MQNTWKIYILAIISFLVGTSEYVISGMLDKIAGSLGVTVAAAGQLITIFSLVYAIGTPVMMALTAKLDRRKLMIYALGLFVIGNIISFLVQGFGLFAGARVIMALGAGTVVVTALTIAAKIAPRENRQVLSQPSLWGLRRRSLSVFRSEEPCLKLSAGRWFSPELRQSESLPCLLYVSRCLR